MRISVVGVRAVPRRVRWFGLWLGRMTALMGYGALLAFAIDAGFQGGHWCHAALLGVAAIVSLCVSFAFNDAIKEAGQ